MPTSLATLPAPQIDKGLVKVHNISQSKTSLATYTFPPAQGLAEKARQFWRAFCWLVEYDALQSEVAALQDEATSAKPAFSTPNPTEALH